MTIKNKLAITFAALALAVTAAAQTAPIQTTLTNVGGIDNKTNTITVASATGIYAPGLNPTYAGISGPTQQNITYLLIDRELLRVNNVTGTTVQVQRGVQGTKAVPHNNAAIVYTMGPSGFLYSYPTGACVAASLKYTQYYLLDSNSTTDGGKWFSCPSTGPNANVWSIANSNVYQNFSDGSFFVPASACMGATTGTAGTGNDTIILDGSVPALKISATNAGASVNTFTCTFQVPTRLTTGKGVTVTSLDFLYGVQTTSATSQTLTTMNSFTGPTAAASETASSATLVAAGGTVTQTPAVASANLTAVSAGQYYTSRASFSSPIAVNTARQTFVFTYVFSQSASAAQIVTTPGFYVNYSIDYF